MVSIVLVKVEEREEGLNAVISIFTESINWYYSDEHTYFFLITFEISQYALVSYKVTSTFCLKAFRTARIVIVSMSNNCEIISIYLSGQNVLKCTGI